MNKIIIIFLLFSLVSCDGPSPEEYRNEGQNILYKIYVLLKPIQTGKELEEIAPQLKQHFNALAELSIAASKKEYQKDYQTDFSSAETTLCAQLRKELNRVCHLSGGCEIIEKSQEEAFFRLAKHTAKDKKNNQ